MSLEQVDQVEPEGAGPAPAEPSDPLAQVLESLERLEALPVNEHVAVFEAAHDQLRRTLNEAGRPSAAG